MKKFLSTAMIQLILVLFMSSLFIYMIAQMLLVVIYHKQITELISVCN